MDGRTTAGAATSRARRRPAYSVCVRVEIPSVWIGVGLAVDCSINRGQGRRRPVKRIRPGPLRRIRVPRRRRRLLFPSSLRALGRQQIRLNASHGNDECTAVGSASKLRGCGAARPARPAAARRDRVTFDHLAAVAARARRPRIDRSRSHSRVTVYNDMVGVGAMVTRSFWNFLCDPCMATLIYLLAYWLHANASSLSIATCRWDDLSSGLSG